MIPNQNIPYPNYIATEKEEKESTFQRCPHDRKNPYAQINRGLLHDKSISLRAKGLLCYLLSLPENWKIYHSQLQEALNEGERCITSAMDELIKAGYAERYRDRLNGQYQPYHYTIREFKKCLPNDNFAPGENSKNKYQTTFTRPVNVVVTKKYSPKGENKKEQTNSLEELSDQQKLFVCSFDSDKEAQEKKKLFNNFGLSRKAIKELIKYSLKQISDAIEAFRQADKIKKIHNPQGWIREAIRKGWKPNITQEDIEKAKIDLLEKQELQTQENIRKAHRIVEEWKNKFIFKKFGIQISDRVAFLIHQNGLLPIDLSQNDAIISIMNYIKYFLSLENKDDLC